MKRGVALEKILPRAEQDVQNGVFIQRRYACFNEVRT